MFTEALKDLTPVSISLLLIVATTCAYLVLSRLWSFLWSPGPWGIPFLGYYPFLRKDYYRQLQEMTKKYGEVYTINLAGQSFVYLGSIRAIKEANLIQGEIFAGRSQENGLVRDMIAHGIVFLDGNEWKAQRKFLMHSLRDAGPVHNKKALTESVITTLRAFAESKGEPTNVYSFLSKQTYSIVRKVMLGPDVEDKEVDNVNNAFLKLIKVMGGLNIVLVGWIARQFILHRNSGYHDFKSGTKEMNDAMENIVRKHAASFNFDHEPRDFIDSYYREKEIRRRKGDPLYKSFTEDSLVANLRQAYIDGSETIAIFLTSFLWHLSANPEAQDLVYEEIARVVGTERLPTTDDKQNLPIVQSTLKELLRLTKLMTVSPGLVCNKDTTIFGVHVPKGCITLFNIWAMNRDPEIYENPEKFETTRFMPDKEKVEPPITFGVGKRACAGEVFVMNEIFLFLTAILQNFRLYSDSEEKYKMQLDVEPMEELQYAISAKLKFVPRKGSGYDGSP